MRKMQQNHKAFITSGYSDENLCKYYLVLKSIVLTRISCWYCNILKIVLSRDDGENINNFVSFNK